MACCRHAEQMPGFLQICNSWLHPPCPIKKRQGLFSAGGEPSQRPGDPHTAQPPLGGAASLLPAIHRLGQAGRARAQRRSAVRGAWSWLEPRNLKYRKQTTLWKPGKLRKLHYLFVFFSNSLFQFPKKNPKPYIYIHTRTQAPALYFSGGRGGRKPKLHSPEEAVSPPWELARGDHLPSQEGEL